MGMWRVGSLAALAMGVSAFGQSPMDEVQTSRSVQTIENVPDQYIYTQIMAGGKPVKGNDCPAPKLYPGTAKNDQEDAAHMAGLAAKASYSFSYSKTSSDECRCGLKIGDPILEYNLKPSVEYRPQQVSVEQNKKVSVEWTGDHKNDPPTSTERLAVWDCSGDADPMRVVCSGSGSARRCKVYAANPDHTSAIASVEESKRKKRCGIYQTCGIHQKVWPSQWCGFEWDGAKGKSVKTSVSGHSDTWSRDNPGDLWADNDIQGSERVAKFDCGTIGSGSTSSTWQGNTWDVTGWAGSADPIYIPDTGSGYTTWISDAYGGEKCGLEWDGDYANDAFNVCRLIRSCPEREKLMELGNWGERRRGRAIDFCLEHDQVNGAKGNKFVQYNDHSCKCNDKYEVDYKHEPAQDWTPTKFLHPCLASGLYQAYMSRVSNSRVPRMRTVKWDCSGGADRIYITANKEKTRQELHADE